MMLRTEHCVAEHTSNSAGASTTRIIKRLLLAKKARIPFPKQLRLRGRPQGDTKERPSACCGLQEINKTLQVYQGTKGPGSLLSSITIMRACVHQQWALTMIFRSHLGSFAGVVDSLCAVVRKHVNQKLPKGYIVAMEWCCRARSAQVWRPCWRATIAAETR